MPKKGRKVENMKAIIEKRNSLKEQHDALLDGAIAEVRGLNEDENAKAEELENEIRSLDALIEKNSNKIKTTKVEVRTETKVEGIDAEKMALRQLIRNEKDNDEFRTYAPMTAGTQTAIIPTQMHKEVVQRVDEVAPLWSKVKKLTPVSGKLEILQEKENCPEAGFVGENASLTQRTFQFDKITLEQHRCGSYIMLTQHLMNDSGIDIVDHSTKYLYEQLGRALERSMILGNPLNDEFQGIEQATSDTAVFAKSGAGTSLDDYINTLNAMHVDHQNGAVWVMHRDEFNRLALLKDSQGHYYITRDVIDDKPAYKLFGQEIIISKHMPNLTGSAKSIAYLINVEKAYAGMIKKEIQFKKIDNDTQNSLNGTSTLVIDIYADAKIKNEDAIKILRTPIIP